MAVLSYKKTSAYWTPVYSGQSLHNCMCQLCTGLTVLTNLCYCCENVFIHMNTLVIGKNSVKLYYSGFYSELNMEDITDADYSHTKWLC